MAIGWGIVGLGTQVDRVMAAAFDKAENTKLVAVCDIDETKAKSFAAQHDVQGAYDYYEKMLEHLLF